MSNPNINPEFESSKILKTAQVAGLEIETTQVVAKRNPYLKVVEFDVRDAESVIQNAKEYPQAWKAYYNEELPWDTDDDSAFHLLYPTPDQVGEVGEKLTEAIKLWLFINEEQEMNIYEGDADEGEYTGVTTEPQSVAQPGEITHYAGNYETPEAYYDGEAYARATNNGAEPLRQLPLDSERVISAKVAGTPSEDALSPEQMGMTEWETAMNRKSARGLYDYGGAYSTGRASAIPIKQQS